MEFNSWRSHPSLEREKKSLSRVKEISLTSRAVTAKKCCVRFIEGPAEYRFIQEKK